ncbi:MFS transporter [Apibacter raozihei]|uniref:MFS transporter n=1 Tax=Apibacter raozihei TaxID=2500547 RepID=UPI000FE40CD2|nr:MFS transporter [Apibacter raozihei]
MERSDNEFLVHNESVDKAKKNSKRFNRIEFCIFLSGICVFAQLYIFQPMLSLVGGEFIVSPAKSSWTVSSSTMGMAIGLFFLAFKADSISRKNVMVFSLIISSLLTILSGFVFNFSLLIILNLIKGIVLAGVSSVALAYLSEEVDIKTLGFAISMYLSGNTTGGMCGRVIAGLLSGWIGWRDTVVIMGIFTLILGILFAILFPDSRFFNPKNTSVNEKLKLMKSFLNDRMMIRLYLVAGLLMGSFIALYNYLGIHLERPPFSLPHYLIAFIFLMYVTGVIGSITIGKWSDAHPPYKLIRIPGSLIIVGLLLMLPNNLVFIIIGLGLFTFSFFATHTLASRMVSQHAKEGKSTATSIYWLFYYVGSSIIGTGTGIIYAQKGWDYFVFTLLGLTVVSFLLSIKLIKKSATH